MRLSTTTSSLLFAFLLLVSLVHAAGPPGSAGAGGISNAPKLASASASETAKAAQSTKKAVKTTDAKNTNAEKTTKAAAKTTAAANTSKAAAKTTNAAKTSGKGSPSKASVGASAITDVGGKTTSGSAAVNTGNGNGVIVGSDAPTVTGGIPNYPSPTVPPTASAPFMQKSTLPQGTVFICVGAVLGFFFVLILAWRGMVAYSLRRSIKRANNGGYTAQMKDYKPVGGGGNGGSMGLPQFYSQQTAGSTMSLDPLTGPRKTGGGIRQSLATKESLFFSPTAGAAVTSTVSAAGNNRGSGYLPAGYYAAGASVAGGGVAGNGRPISMADFTQTRPQSSGYMHAAQESPELQPEQLPEIPYGRLNQAGLSTASLTTKSEGRAPSAFLDDLFDAPLVPEHGRR